MILLFYMADPKYGGWPTYTSHLFHGLAMAGKSPVLYKVGSRSESKDRPFGRGIMYRNVSVQDALFMAKNSRCFITAVGKSQYQNAAKMIASGASVCVHDPTELKEPFASSLPSARIVVIREKMLEHLPHARFIRHPYRPCGHRNSGAAGSACSISRVDHDKNTLMIAEANKLLSPPVKIYGAMNRIYSHFKLDAECPGWETNYMGSPKADSLWAGAKIASKHQYTVDMSVIKGDGGGTQYTFLEALDAGSRLIIHEGWNATGDLKKASIQVGSAKELAKALQSRAKPQQSADSMLKQHDCKSVAQDLFDYVSR